MDKAAFLYEDVAAQVESQISQGVLSPGDKMPSLRSLSRELGISVSTAMQAYGVLEGRGAIEARTRSGYYVRGLPPTLTALPGPTCPDPDRASVPGNRMLHRFLKALHIPGCVKLGCASPGLELLPLKRLSGYVNRTARNLTESAFDYALPPGSPELRRQISRRSLHWMGAVSPDDIVVTSGGMDALHLALRAVTNPGDTVVIESPTFFGLLQVLEHLGLRALELPTCPVNGIDIDALEHAASLRDIKAVMLIPCFNNPLGSLMPDESKQRLVELSTRHGFFVIEDDIYGELHYGSRRPLPVKAFDTEDRVLLCSSFSKSLAPGLRTGWLVSRRFHDRVASLQFNTTVCGVPVMQIALAEFLDGGSYDAHLRRFRLELAGIRDRFLCAGAEYFPKGTRFTQPKGGYVMWVELPEQINSVVLFEQALNEHVIFAPGPLFSSQPRYQNCIRLNYARRWSEEYEGAIKTLGKLAKSLM